MKLISDLNSRMSLKVLAIKSETRGQAPKTPSGTRGQMAIVFHHFMYKQCVTKYSIINCNEYNKVSIDNFVYILVIKLSGYNFEIYLYFKKVKLGVHKESKLEVVQFGIYELSSE